MLLCIELSFQLPFSAQTMDNAELLARIKDSAEIFENLGLVTKALLCFLTLAVLIIIFIVSERVYEHRAYNSRKLWIGQAQRTLNRKLPPVRMVKPNRRDEDLESIL